MSLQEGFAVLFVMPGTNVSADNNESSVGKRRAPHYGAMQMRAGRLLIGLEFKIQPSDWSKGHLPHSGNKGK